VSLSQFEAMSAQGEFIDHRQIFGHRYGLARASVLQHIAAGRISVIRVDVEGAIRVIQELTELASVFIAPPSMDELRRRLQVRARVDRKTIEAKLEGADFERSQSSQFDIIISNRDVESTVRGVEAFVSERMGRRARGPRK